MKTGTQRKISKFILGLLIVVAVAACSKDDVSDNEKPPVGVTNTLVQLVLSDSIKTGELKSDKIKLADITLAKVEYIIDEGGISPNTKVIKTAELIMASDSLRSSSLDRRIFNFKTGSTMTIHSVELFDAEGELLGTSSMSESDTFKVVGKDGKSVLKRVYGTIAAEK